MFKWIKGILAGVNKMLAPWGFQISRRSTTRKTMAEALQHVARIGFIPQTVIDVGVAYGTVELYEAFPHARHLLVEPLAEYQGVLDAIAGKYNAEYVLAAASASPGTTVIHVHPELSGSSIYREAEGGHVDGIPREVPLVTLDDLCRERGLRGPYLIKADVQGAELQILEGAKKILEETELVLLEVSLFQFFLNGPQFHDVVSNMKDHGFVVYDIFGGHCRPFDNALAQVDVAFVKEHGRFRQSHCYATREQRWQLMKVQSTE